MASTGGVGTVLLRQSKTSVGGVGRENFCKGIKMSARLLDYLKDKYRLESDMELARELGVSAPTLSRVRMGHKEVGANLILAIHDAFEMSIKDIKGMLNGGSNDRAN